jgi:hypothetical protein
MLVQIEEIVHDGEIAQRILDLNNISMGIFIKNINNKYLIFKIDYFINNKINRKIIN